MARMLRTVLVLVLAVAGSSALTGCGSSDDAATAPTPGTETVQEGVDGYEVTLSSVSGEDTQEMAVWAPDTEGSWPVVFAIPGTDYRTYAKEPATEDVECGYRYAHQIAAEYGGDLSAPVTMLGFSMGGMVVLVNSLDAWTATSPRTHPRSQRATTP